MEKSEDLLEEQIQEAKEKIFGRRYLGASLPNLIISSDNERKLASYLRSPKATLLIRGPSGAGKTYLMATVFEALTKKFKNKMRQEIYTENELIGRLKNFEGGNYYDEAAHISNAHILYIDDMGTVTMTDWRKEALYSIIDRRYRSLLPTIITTTLNDREINEFYGVKIGRRLLDEENTFIQY